MIYLDHAAATPVDDAVLAAMQPFFTDDFYNPSATYAPAQAVRASVDAARAEVAHWLGARPAEIVWTAGGTEANNLAIRGVMQQFAGQGCNVVVSAVEHESVLAAAHQYECREAAVGPDGVVDLAALEKTIDENTVLVSVMYANNEVGTIQPLRKIAQLLVRLRQERAARGNHLPLYFHTDAAQAAAYADLHTARLGVDMLTLNAGKIYGPKQVGALYVAAGVRLSPQVFGGGQERGLRSGTENVPGIIGLAAALRLVQSRRHEESRRLRHLQQYFFSLAERELPGARVNGSRKTRLPNNVHITLPGHDNERLIFQLDAAGILCAAGSACSADSAEPSHVLRAMGVPNADARASLRFTMGAQTTEADIQKTVATLRQLA